MEVLIVYVFFNSLKLNYLNKRIFLNSVIILTSTYYISLWRTINRVTQEIMHFYYFLLPISRESIVFGWNFRSWDFDGFTRFEILWIRKSRAFKLLFNHTWKRQFEVLHCNSQLFFFICNLWNKEEYLLIPYFFLRMLCSFQLLLLKKKKG